MTQQDDLAGSAPESSAILSNEMLILAGFWQRSIDVHTKLPPVYAQVLDASESCFAGSICPDSSLADLGVPTVLRP